MTSATPLSVLPDYAELHCISNFTFLTGASHPHELVERAKLYGYQALALTDECSVAGTARALVASREHDLKLIIGSRFIFSGIELKPAEVAVLQAQHQYQDYLRQETLRVIVPYLVLGSVVLLWAVLIALTRFPHTGLDYSRNTIEHDISKPLWRRRHFVFAVLAQFLYVGAQVGAWSWQIPYVQAYTGVGERTAGYLLTAALVALTAGRFFSSWLLHRVRASHLLAVFAIAVWRFVAAAAASSRATRSHGWRSRAPPLSRI